VDNPVDLSNADYEEMLHCPQCLGAEVSTEWTPDIFQQGSGKDAQQLIVSIPVRECAQCHFRWTDHAGEVIRDSLVRVYCRDRQFQAVGHDEE